MAILNFGPGNWAGLPEFGITETLGGKSRSIYDATQRKNATAPTVKGTSTAQYGPAVPQNLTPNPTNSSSTPSTGGGSSSSGNSSSSSKSSSSKNSSMSEQDVINQEFKNYVDSLGGLASNAQAQAGTARGQIQNEYNTGLQTFDQQLATGQQDLANRRTDVGLNAQLGNVRIKQALDQLKQRDIARLSNMGAFGSSTADATAERYGRTALSQIGGLENQKQSSLASIDNEATKLNDFINSKKSELQLSYQRGINDIETSLQSRLQQIDQLKGEASSNKARATLDAWKNYTNSVNQFKNNMFSVASQLEQWAVSQGNTLQQARDYALGATQGLDPASFGVISPNQGYSEANNQTLPAALPSTIGGIRLTNLGQDSQDNQDLLNGVPSTIWNQAN